MTVFTMLAVLPALLAFPEETFELRDTLSESFAVSSVKMLQPLEKLASPVTSVNLAAIENAGLKNPKDMSFIVPNLMIPDYGSSMTSSIYLRGFGSRIDNPVMGLYIDDVPVMNKNSYDFDFMDIRRIDVLRGPQGTLYGRNSMCGVLSATTLSPFSYQGARASANYGAYGSAGAGASVYRLFENGFGLGAALKYSHRDGYYVNEYDGRPCDPSDALSVRLRAGKRFSEKLFSENILSFSWLDEGGWPYSHEGTISYNDICSYRRTGLTEAIKIVYGTGDIVLSSVTSWQLLSDRMELDQDFTPASMFTLSQKQFENVLTQEIVLKPAGEKGGIWEWQTGVFVFCKHNDMSAPVHFKEDGIRELILDSANANIPAEIGRLDFMEDDFVISSDFGILTGGAAIYHESYLNKGNWSFSAGLRLGYEGNRMNYSSRSLVHYMFSPTMTSFKPVETVYEGSVSDGYVEIMPRLSASYECGGLFRGRGNMRFSAVVSRGFKSGGFNTQIFSDILQNLMMETLMSDLGVYFDGEAVNNVSAGNTVYRPESSWNYETGVKMTVAPATETEVDFGVSAFYIDCRNQQMTVFPPGKSTGRMMANAGRSASAGVEAEISVKWKNLAFNAGYGFTDARFIDYFDRNTAYDGNFIPYSPGNTLNMRISYRYNTDCGFFRGFTAAAGCNGAGKIYWDEGNTSFQPFYILLNAGLMLHFGIFDIILRGDNLSGTKYRTFRFKSVGNSFYQEGKPLLWSVGISFEI